MGISYIKLPHTGWSLKYPQKIPSKYTIVTKRGLFEGHFSGGYLGGHPVLNIFGNLKKSVCNTT